MQPRQVWCAYVLVLVLPIKGAAFFNNKSLLAAEIARAQLMLFTAMLSMLNFSDDNFSISHRQRETGSLTILIID